ncbi:hypothetical protein N7486_005882 [Penicillium sp. IBT 16267x]|nr:hypothetical protein N7486_005882 [Penicillium sp. IBT 16267x]
MAPGVSIRVEGRSNELSYQSLRTRYVQMIMEADEVLLAGYLVVPGTFTSLQKSNTVHNGLSDNEAGRLVLNTIQNPPLLALACIFFVVGLIVTGWLYYEYRGNYIWLTNRIFMCIAHSSVGESSTDFVRPTLLNSSAGLLTTMISLYTGHGGDWSIMALLTVIASGLSFASSSTLLILYKFVKLVNVKQEHNQMISAHHHFVHYQEL